MAVEVKKSKGTPWTKEEDDTLKQLHAQGLPLNQIRIAMERSRSTVGAAAKRLGLSFDRTMMEEAIKASQLDRRSRRQALADKMMTVAENVTDRMLAPEFVALVNVGMGEQRERTLTHIPPADARNLSATLANILQRVEAIDKIDDDGGAEEARGILEVFAEQVTAAYKAGSKG